MLKAIEKALLLQEMDLFRFASADHLMQLAESASEETFGKDDAIVRGGEASSKLYFLLIGRASFEGSGERILERTAVNLYSCLAGVEHAAGCFCIEDCTVLSIPAASFLDLLAGEPELSMALLKYLASKHLAGSPQEI